ncbi:hypothetical protein PCH_Pc22g12230 [Penicillium rubens Wisconsin 54-1255]|uniref:Uncharacterized protein n=1 Tax=Penicillium rubens (strain ATCC 28089 / DSM 1075 / NRRL 1951 / Wisconsin 54-1255) TaxID=500485 RepID=B6HRG6_PENRW|nr:hypothetical protein PCH_Pc22g12230 [Penicillium rubens Wisconsin 54-1255]
MAVARKGSYQEKTQRTGIMMATELPGPKRGIDKASSEHPSNDPNDTSFFTQGCCIESNWECDSRDSFLQFAIPSPLPGMGRDGTLHATGVRRSCINHDLFL